jgi:hypothetical protein
MNSTVPHADPAIDRRSRRSFLLTLAGTTLAVPGVLAGNFGPDNERLTLRGPGSKYVPRIHAAFVRRAGDYGMLWPGAIYDGAGAEHRYRAELMAAEQALGLSVRLRPQAIHSLAEADAWLGQAVADRADGLLVLLLDRQQHAWPTATKAVATGVPTVVFSPVGTSFTTNTAPLADKPGVFIASTSDFAQAQEGLKMIKAGARLREMRYIVLQGKERKETRVAHFGTQLRYLPAASFLDEYNRTPANAEVQALAKSYLHQARRTLGPTRDDVLNGIRSFVVARNILEREEGDGITMDCLGALGQTRVSLPCIAWSKMLDRGIPAACEADLGAAVTHALVQFLFDRPGFQQDPVAETRRECLIGAHCSCPTRLRGFGVKAEPFDLVHHHGARDAVPRPRWPLGQRVTVVDAILPAAQEYTRDRVVNAAQMVIGTGTVVENVAVPPAGGCVVSVMLKLDTQPDLLSYPGFHQLFVCGDFKKDLLDFCRLYGIQPVVA